MIQVWLVPKIPPVLDIVPDVLNVVAGLLAAPVSDDPGTFRLSVSQEPFKSGPELLRWLQVFFLDVEVPQVVEGVRKVHLHPAELQGVGSSCQLSPASVTDESAVAVEVEPLVLEEARIEVFSDGLLRTVL